MGTDRGARLLEREADLASLASFVDAGAAGDGGLVAIEGGAGVGKTSLLGEARMIATEAGLRVLSARSSQLEQEFAFGVVRQLFEPVLAAASDHVRAELLVGAAELAAPLFEVTAIVEPPPERDVSFARLHGLYWLAVNLAMSTPTALIIDDLHWCDGPSLRWLLHVARRLEALPLIVVAATRPPQHARHGLLITELVADPAAAILRPAELGTESIASLVRDSLGAEPDGRFCAACQQVTGGNPLYLRALLSTLAEEGLEPSAQSAERVHAIGPEPIARLVSLRLSRLSPDAEVLARAVAVLDSGADMRLAAELAGVEPGAATAALGALVEADILRLEPRLEFTHPIIRTSVYERIAGPERAGAHRRAARLLSDTSAEPEQAAAHLLAVPAGGDAADVSVLELAARRALVRGDATAAVAYLRRALAEPGSRELRSALLSELGRAERGIDVAAAAKHLYEAVALTEDVDEQAELALECGRALYFGLRNEAARDVFAEAAQALGSRRADLRELLDAEMLHVSWFEPDLYPSVRERLASLQPAELTGGAGSELLLAAFAHYQARIGIDRVLCLDLAEKALASRNMEHGSSFGLYYALIAVAVAGDLQTAASAWHSALRAARRRGDLLTTLSTLTWTGFCAHRRGELRNAEADIREAIELADRTDFPLARVYTAAFLAEILLARGEVPEAEDVLTDCGFGERPPESVHFAYFLAARGKVRLAGRRVRPALEDFSAIGRMASTLDLDNPAYTPWRSDSALALLALGDTDGARRLAEEELVLARRWGEARAIGISLRALALTQDGAAREQQLREAADMLATADAALEHASTRVELGAALRRANQRTEAREHLRHGVELAQRCGATALAQRGNEELAATGARPRKMLQNGPEALTPRERRVALLAADEMSNKEIAQALFVTVKTVEVHLSSVYRKLSVSSRRKLALALGDANAVGASVG